MSQSWVRFHFEHLRRWREYACIVAKAARMIVPGARVYVTGSVAAGTYTVLSDIDILVVVPKGLLRRGLSRDIMVKAMDIGLPWDAPVELHVVEEGEEKHYTPLVPVECQEESGQGQC